jgi:ribosomal protein S18 acetylase RimI-like enzyme
MTDLPEVEPPWHIEPATSVAQLVAAGHLFDRPVEPESAQEFVDDPRHHLLLAVDRTGHPVGFVSGVVLVHPDKGREMFLYELGVDGAARGQGIATSLVRALRDLARENACRGMWVLTDDDNPAAVRAYLRGGASEPTHHALLEWTLP